MEIKPLMPLSMLKNLNPSNLDEAKKLLATANLPLAGWLDHLENTLVTLDGNKVTGTISAEIYKQKALLRSLVISEAYRGQGLGILLTKSLLRELKEKDIKDIFLLTTTARDFFTRLGFKEITWDDLPDIPSAELNGACPKTATAMHQQLLKP